MSYWVRERAPSQINVKRQVDRLSFFHVSRDMESVTLNSIVTSVVDRFGVRLEVDEVFGAIA